MYILAIDTSSQSCSVCVLDDESILVELNFVKRETHSKHLLLMIDRALSMVELSLSNIDGFAVTKGPGSFTGLRIGISTIKGLTFAMNKPVVSVSSLDVLSNQVSNCRCYDFICSVLDARKNEVYAALYTYENDLLTKINGEQLIKPERLASQINKPCIFIGDGALQYEDVIKAKSSCNVSFLHGYNNCIKASTVGLISLKKFLHNETDNINDLVPNYIRKSEAQINLEKKKSLLNI